MGQSESSYDNDLEFPDNKNNASVANYPNSPAIISQPHYGSGGYPHQDYGGGGGMYYGGQQQKDGGYGYNNPHAMNQGGGYPMPPGQQPYGQNMPYPPQAGGPPPPYSYHQGPPPPGTYFPPQGGDYQNPQHYPNAPVYPPTHNMQESGKY